MDLSQKRVRIVDIAEALGLSTATVSNVIHGKTSKSSGRWICHVIVKCTFTRSKQKGIFPYDKHNGRYQRNSGFCIYVEYGWTDPHGIL